MTTREERDAMELPSATFIPAPPVGMMRDSDSEGEGKKQVGWSSKTNSPPRKS